MKFLEYVEQVDNKDILPQGPLVGPHRVTECPLPKVRNHPCVCHQPHQYVCILDSKFQCVSSWSWLMVSLACSMNGVPIKKQFLHPVDVTALRPWNLLLPYLPTAL